MRCYGDETLDENERFKAKGLGAVAPRGAEFPEETQFAGVPADQARQFWIGVGVGLASTGEVPAVDGEWSGFVPGANWVHLWQGVGAGMRHALGEEEARTALGPLLNTLEPGLSLALDNGLLWPQYPSPGWFSGQ